MLRHSGTYQALHSYGRRHPLFAVLIILTLTLAAFPALAHVKWFAPYIVGAAPRPIVHTLTDQWFWLGIVLVLVFFVATLAIEKTATGHKALDGLDRLTGPLWLRLDDFVRVVIGAFFVAIFSVGGIYLTPDLTTPSEWVSWMQLLIAALIFSRKTQPLAGLGIIALWLLALRDYDLFHLLDYLALGVGVAAYLVLEASGRENWRRHRFEVLRWGVAIALMWSSLEKFAYPDWFYPLVQEKPFLTFGLPRDVFIPMAGVSEFTLGFGFLWTPLVRRLSAISLFVIFTAAVYPFGRIDLVGHALIMAIIVAIFADHERDVHFLPRVKKALWGVPLGLTAALVLFIGSYWGLHRLIYGPEGTGAVLPANMDMSTHSYDPQNPHGPEGVSISERIDTAPNAQEAYSRAMDIMHVPMMEGIKHPDPDAAFALSMIPHHKGALDMARIQLKYGKDKQMRQLARDILTTQHYEVILMERWVRQKDLMTRPTSPAPAPAPASAPADDAAPENVHHGHGR